MNDADRELLDEQNRNHQQTIEYGKDLARIYSVEKARRKELETAYMLLDAIFNSMPDGLIVIDDNCIIRQVNPALNNMLKLEGIISGLPLDDLPIGSKILPLLKQLEDVRFGSLQTEIALNQPRVCILLANIAPIRTEAFEGWVIVLRERDPCE
ncbi:MAG: PAS domain-containing protein [Anaerolineae bacterium]|nr:PAS domain-containing protein [Anaerolineae bacterium]